MLILAIFLSAVVSYLLGSFNSSILVVRLWITKISGTMAAIMPD